MLCNTFQIWCGAGVNLSGGKTRDGGLAVGGSVFYADEAKETVVVKGEVEDAVEHLDKELQESEQRRLEAEQQDQQLSSLVWICTSTQKMSKVSVIDANNPADILQVFNVCQSHLLCIASVPGAKESDYIHNTEDSSPRIVNGISETELGNVQRANHNSDQSIAGEATTSNETKNCQKIEDSNDQSQATSEGPSSLEEKPSDSSVKITDIDHSSNTEPQSLEIADSESALIGKIYFVQSNIDNTSTRREIDSDEPKASDDNDATIEKISSIQPTMWLGAQNGAIYVHSAVAKWSICLHTVMLKDAVLGIV